MSILTASPYPFVRIEFEKILQQDFDQAIAEHIAGPNNSKAWGRLATSSPAFRKLAVGLGAAHKVNPAVVAGLLSAGMNAGYFLSEKMRGRMIQIVDAEF